MSGEQMSHDVQKFCNDIGTTLRALEEGTPWSNKAELYIGLLKEAVQKDMRESNSYDPMGLLCGKMGQDQQPHGKRQLQATWDNASYCNHG